MPAMPRHTLPLLAAALTALVPLPAQDTAPIGGQWVIDSIGIPDQVQLTLHRSFGKNGSLTNSSAIVLGALHGLNRAQMDSANGTTAQFSIARDAGTLACEGYFKRGNGAGTFTFSPSPGFAAEMRKLGYSVETTEMFFSMAAHDVSLAYV